MQNKLAQNLFKKELHSKVICVSQNFLPQKTEYPELYDIPVSSLARSGSAVPISAHENLKCGVELGIVFNEDLGRTSQWSREK